MTPAKKNTAPSGTAKARGRARGGSVTHSGVVPKLPKPKWDVSDIDS